MAFLIKPENRELEQHPMKERLPHSNLVFCKSEYQMKSDQNNARQLICGYNEEDFQENSCLPETDFTIAMLRIWNSKQKHWDGAICSLILHSRTDKRKNNYMRICRLV